MVKSEEIRDPFQMVVDLQLQSISGLIETELSRNRYPGKARGSQSGPQAQGMVLRKRPDTYRSRESLENALIWAYDLKYHRNGGLLERKVEELCRIGYTERQISSMLDIGKGTVWRVKKRLKLEKGSPGKRTRGIQYG